MLCCAACTFFRKRLFTSLAALRSTSTLNIKENSSLKSESKSFPIVISSTIVLCFLSVEESGGNRKGEW